MNYNVDKEVEHLVHEFKRLGTKNDDGTYDTTFGVLFKDGKFTNAYKKLTTSILIHNNNNKNTQILSTTCWRVWLAQ